MRSPSQTKACPVIGITTNTPGLKGDPEADPPKRVTSAVAYAQAVVKAGGLPVLLPQAEAVLAETVALLDGLILTGGADPSTEPFGEPTHPAAKVMVPARQAFELKLLQQRQQDKPDMPLLGVCWGMQLLALFHGGSLEQHMPDRLGDEPAERHRGSRRHPLVFEVDDSQTVLPIREGQTVVSSHHQAVRDPGSLRIIARHEDGTVEAIDDPSHAFCLGVQWHPERGGEGELNEDLFATLVDACRA